MAPKQKYNILLKEMAGMDNESDYHLPYSSFADSLPEEIQNGIKSNHANAPEPPANVRVNIHEMFYVMLWEMMGLGYGYMNKKKIIIFDFCLDIYQKPGIINIR